MQKENDLIECIQFIVIFGLNRTVFLSKIYFNLMRTLIWKSCNLE